MLSVINDFNKDYIVANPPHRHHEHHRNHHIRQKIECTRIFHCAKKCGDYTFVINMWLAQCMFSEKRCLKRSRAVALRLEAHNFLNGAQQKNNLFLLSNLS